MDLTDLSSALSNSLSLGSILILTALGLSITFGVMGVINMAHGEMMMLGAYTALAVSTLVGAGSSANSGLTLLLAIPASFLVVAFVGYLMEVSLIRFLYGRPLDTLLATWGVGMILQQVVLLRFGANLQPMHLPEALQGAGPSAASPSQSTGFSLLGSRFSAYWPSTCGSTRLRSG